MSRTKSTLFLLKGSGGFILITLWYGPSVLSKMPFSLNVLIIFEI